MTLETDIAAQAKENLIRGKTRPILPFKPHSNSTLDEDSIQYKISHLLERFADLTATISRMNETLNTEIGKLQD